VTPSVRGQRSRVTTTFLAVALALAAVFADEPARFLVASDPPRETDAALVLAGDPDYERTRTAVRLVLSKQARLLILTGGEPGPGDSAESLRQVALGLGVPAEVIRMEQVSRSTRESMLAVREILAEEGIRTLAVVTSPYHQRRAAWTAKRALPGIEIVSRPADPSFWRPADWWKTRPGRRIVVGEYAKLAYYMLRGWVWPVGRRRADAAVVAMPESLSFSAS
jgi:uncharacterized SAM-binding protein YcdF (DUF218 family)